MSVRPWQRRQRGRDGTVGAVSAVGGARLLGGPRKRRHLRLLVVADVGRGLRPRHLRQRRLCQWHLRVPRGLAGHALSILRRESQVRTVRSPGNRHSPFSYFLPPLFLFITLPSVRCRLALRSAGRSNVRPREERLPDVRETRAGERRHSTYVRTYAWRRVKCNGIPPLSRSSSRRFDRAFRMSGRRDDGEIPSTPLAPTTDVNKRLRACVRACVRTCFTSPLPSREASSKTRSRRLNDLPIPLQSNFYSTRSVIAFLLGRYEEKVTDPKIPGRVISERAAGDTDRTPREASPTASP